MKRIRKTLVVGIGALALVYLGICAYMYVIQDSMVFHPRPLRDANLLEELVRFQSIENKANHPLVRDNPLFEDAGDAFRIALDYEILVDESQELHVRGQVLLPDASGPVLIFFGGNAYDNTYLLPQFLAMTTTSVLTNYRGYGLSEGEPSERAILADTDLIIDWVEAEFPDRDLILMGYSLGSGVAVKSAADRNSVKGVVLLSPYRSLVHVAERNTIFGLLPLRLLMKHQFNTLDALKKLPDKVLIIYSDPDYMISPLETREVIRLVPHAEEVVFDVNHHRLARDSQVWQQVQTWISANFH